jgi:hypothetical protein
MEREKDSVFQLFSFTVFLCALGIAYSLWVYVGIARLEKRIDENQDAVVELNEQFGRGEIGERVNSNER